jgi:hypothetical protein
MFHQANFRSGQVPSVGPTKALSTNNGGAGGTAAYGSRLSLIAAWVEYIVQGYNQYVVWPMVTYKLDDMEIMFKNRAIREQAGVQFSVIGTSNGITSVTMSAVSACTAPFTLPLNLACTAVTSLPAGATTERIGSDPCTIWVPLTAGQTITIAFQSAIGF